MNDPRGYTALKQLAQAHGAPIPDLLALARQNDPFFAGAPGQQLKAAWFAALWEEFGFSHGVHLRRIHYRLVSQADPPTRHDGTPYENTESCWGYLCEAGKAARYLRLCDPDAFVDRRNPDPQLFVTPGGPRDEPAWEVEAEQEATLPYIPADLGLSLSLAVPRPYVSGYDYQDVDQPFHVELWVEKSTMDDVLQPLCRQHGLNLVTSLGFQSITGTIALLKRAAGIGAGASSIMAAEKWTTAQERSGWVRMAVCPGPALSVSAPPSRPSRRPWWRGARCGLLRNSMGCPPGRSCGTRRGTCPPL